MKIKVFYNKSCNLCDSEINHYKKYSNNNFKWIDITNNKDALKYTSKTYEQLIRRIHVIKGDKLLIGSYAFLEIWRNVPKYRFLYHFFKIRMFFIILHLLYEVAAYILFLKNKSMLQKNE